MLTANPFQSEAFLVGAAIVAAAVVLVGALGLRKIGWRERVGATAIRLVVLACVVGILAGRSMGLEDVSPSGVVLIDETAPMALSERVRRDAAEVDARIWEVTSQGVTERGQPVAATTGEALRRLVADAGLRPEHAPPFIDALLKAEDTAEARMVLSGSPLRTSVRPLYPELDPVPESLPKAPGDGEGDAFPSIRIHGAPVVLAHEPSRFGVSLAGMPEGASVRMTLNGAVVRLSSNGDRSMTTEPLALDLGEHRIEVTATKDGREFVRAWRSVAAIEGEEVVVLSGQRRLVDVFHALLPRFKVVGLDPAVGLEIGFLNEARAAVLPLSSARGLESEAVAVLEAYVRDGGLLLVTGLTEDEMRASGIGGPVADLLPVVVRVPPPLPESEPEPEVPEPEKPDEKPPEDPKPDQPGKPTVKEERGVVEVAKVSVVFALDNSPSMASGGRWTNACAAIRAALEGINEYDRIGLMIFGDTSTWAVGGGIVDVTPDSSKMFREYLGDASNVPREDTLTDIAAAVETALDALAKETSAVRLLVVISDGDEGIKRDIDREHLALSSKAIKQQTMIATIRVGDDGPKEWLRRADKVMSALATREDLKAVVADREGEVRIPKLSVVYVQLAYQRHSELEREKQLEEAERAAEERRKKEEAERLAREEEERRRAELEEAERKRLEELDRQRREEEERLAREAAEQRRKEQEEREKLLIPGGFVLGVTPLVVQRAWDSLGLGPTPPPIGEGVARADRKPGAEALLTARSGGASWSFAALARRGGGNVVWIGANFDGVSLGSWLSAPDQPAAMLDHGIRRLGRSRLGELSPMLAFEVDSGRVVAQFTRDPGEVKFVGVSEAGMEFTLAPKIGPAGIEAVVPPMATFVELRDADGRVLARASTVRVKVRREQASVGIAIPLPADPVEYVAPTRTRREVPDPVWPVMLLALGLVLMPLERWLRRT